MTMNIGIDIRPLMTKNRTGVGEYTYELLNAIFETDRANRYFLFYNSRTDVSANVPFWKQDNVQYVIKRWPNKLFNASVKITGRPKIDRWMSRAAGKLDAFYSPNFNFTALSAPATFALTVHDLSFEHFPEFFTAKQRLWHRLINPKKQCARARLIFVPSQSTKQDLAETYGIAEEKIRVIYPGLSAGMSAPGRWEPERIKKKYHLPDHYILFLGAIEPRKNIVGLIEAFEKVQALFSQPYALVLAGARGWQNEKIYARANASPARDRIKFIGFVPAEEKPALYAGAGCFAYPSFYEGFGFPVLEAMACGTPVVTADRSSLPEVAGRAACLVNPFNSGSIADGLYEAIANHHRRGQMTAAGRIQAEKFSWRRAAKEWIAAMENF